MEALLLGVHGLHVLKLVAQEQKLRAGLARIHLLLMVVLLAQEALQTQQIATLLLVL